MVEQELATAAKHNSIVEGALDTDVRGCQAAYARGIIAPNAGRSAALGRREQRAGGDSAQPDLQIAKLKFRWIEGERVGKETGFGCRSGRGCDVCRQQCRHPQSALRHRDLRTAARIVRLRKACSGLRTIENISSSILIGHIGALE